MSESTRDVIARGPDREPRRPVWWPLIALALLVAVAVVAWQGRGGDARPAPATPSPAPESSAPQAKNAVVARIPMGTAESPQVEVAIGDGAVWVADWGLARLVKVSTATNRVVAQRALDTDFEASAIAYGAGSLWGVDEEHGRVLRLDPRTLRVTARVKYGGMFDSLMAFGAGRLWVLSCCDQNPDSAILTRIDPRTNRATRVPVPGGGRGSMLLAGGYGVWTDTAYPALTRLDPKTARIAQRVAGGRSGGPAAVGGDAVWTISGDARLLRIGEGIQERAIGPEGSGAGVEAIGAGPDGVFAATHDGRLLQIDERTLRIVRAGVVVDPTVPQWSQLLSGGSDGVWLATNGELVRIDPGRLPLVSRG